MAPRRRVPTCFLPAALGLAMGCSGTAPSSSPAAAQPATLVPAKVPLPKASGTLNLALVGEGPAGGFEEVHLNLAGLGIKQPGGEWVALTMAEHRVEMMNLKGQPVPPLTRTTEVPAGKYHELRVRFAPGHSVKLREGGAVRDLEAPDEFVATGLSLDLQPNANLDAVFFFRTAQAILETPSSGQFALHPAQGGGACLDRRATVAIVGRLSMGGTKAAVAGAVVMATVGASDSSMPDQQKIIRTTTSDANGQYEMFLLPNHGDYRVVVLPGAHQPKVSRPLGEYKGFPWICNLVLEPLQGGLTTLVVADALSAMGELILPKKLPTM